MKRACVTGHRPQTLNKLMKYGDFNDIPYMEYNDAIDLNRKIISIDEKYDVVADREWWRRVFELAVDEWKKAYPSNGEFD